MHVNAILMLVQLVYCNAIKNIENRVVCEHTNIWLKKSTLVQQIASTQEELGT